MLQWFAHQRGCSKRIGCQSCWRCRSSESGSLQQQNCKTGCCCCCCSLRSTVYSQTEYYCDQCLLHATTTAATGRVAARISLKHEVLLGSSERTNGRAPCRKVADTRPMPWLLRQAHEKALCPRIAFRYEQEHYTARVRVDRLLFWLVAQKRKIQPAAATNRRAERNSRNAQGAIAGWIRSCLNLAWPRE